MNSNDFIKHCIDLKYDIEFIYNSVISEFGYKPGECCNHYCSNLSDRHKIYSYNFGKKYFVKFNHSSSIIIRVVNKISEMNKADETFSFIIFYNDKLLYPASYMNSYNSLDSLKNSMNLKFKELELITAEEAVIKDIIE